MCIRDSLVAQGSTPCPPLALSSFPSPSPLSHQADLSDTPSMDPLRTCCSCRKGPVCSPSSLGWDLFLMQDSAQRVSLFPRILPCWHPWQASPLSLGILSMPSGILLMGLYLPHDTVFYLRFYLFIFRERGRQGGRKRGETHQCAKDTSIGCLSHTLN